MTLNVKPKAMSCAKTDSDKSADSEVRNFSGGIWLHIRILYCMLLFLTLGSSFSLWACFREVSRLRQDFEGEIVPRGSVDFAHVQGDYADRPWVRRAEEEYMEEDELDSLSDTPEVDPIASPTGARSAPSGYEIVNGESQPTRSEELLRVKRHAAGEPAPEPSKRRSRKRKRDKDEKEAWAFIRGSTDPSNTGEGSGAPVPDDWVWLTSYSRIPVFALQEFCAATKDYCPPGPPGVMGPPGRTGGSGPAGPKGGTGHLGSKGDKGDVGEAGQKGDEGVIGPIGFPGADGPKGYKGEIGWPGFNGTQGDEGPPGPAGPPGVSGERGPAGEPGYNGTSGRRGKRGKTGLSGLSGETGLTGDTGKDGPRGLKGDTGLPGQDADTQNCTCPPGPYATGPPGPVGMAGPEGHKGQKGEPGSSNLILDTTLRTTTTTPATTTPPITTPEPIIDPRTSHCSIRMVGKPLFQRYTGTYWGAWMKDTKRGSPPDSNRFWFTRHFTGNSLHEYANQEEFRADRESHVYELTELFFGTGHAIHDGAFIYHKSGSPDLVKYQLTTESVTGKLRLPYAAFQNKEYVYRTEYNYIDLAADENGFWAIYAAEGEPQSLLVSKIDTVAMEIEKTWNISVNHRSYGNGFITCGVLYLINETHLKTTYIDFAYDLYTKQQLKIERLQFTNPFQMNNMISYNPLSQEIYSWDKGNQLTYPLLI